MPTPTPKQVASNVATGTSVDMIDNSGNVISYPEYLGLETFVMHDTGPAY